MNATAKAAPRKLGLIFRYPLTLLTLVGLTCSQLASALHALYDGADWRALIFWIGVLLSYPLLAVRELLAFVTRSEVPWPMAVAVGLVLVLLIDHFVVRRLTPSMWRVVLYLALAIAAIWLVF
jgi:hypothetical protein